MSGIENHRNGFQGNLHSPVTVPLTLLRDRFRCRVDCQPRSPNHRLRLAESISATSVASVVSVLTSRTSSVRYELSFGASCTVPLFGHGH